jgi:DNA-binding NarL/FixJ family response regulator
MPVDSFRILIVDDHLIVRQGLRQVLGELQGFNVVGEAADGFEAVDRARELQPDIILMDIRMPRCDGLAATARIRQVLPGAKVVMLTAYASEPTLIYRALQAGASGFLSKNAGIDEFVEAVRRVANGQSVLGAPSLTSLVSFIATQTEGPRTDTLTDREKEVIELVATGQSNREIAAALCVTEATVRSHFHNILAKLGLSNRVQVAAFALKAKSAIFTAEPLGGFNVDSRLLEQLA